MLIAETQTPGTGICDPNRNTAKRRAWKRCDDAYLYPPNAFLMKVNIRSPRLIHQLRNLLCSAPLNLAAWTVNFLSSWPLPTDFYSDNSFLTTPASTKRAGVTLSYRLRSGWELPKLTTAYSLRLMLLNHVFGKRRNNWVCPPSKPKLYATARTGFWPFWPRDQQFYRYRNLDHDRHGYVLDAWTFGGFLMYGLHSCGTSLY